MNIRTLTLLGSCLVVTCLFLTSCVSILDRRSPIEILSVSQDIPVYDGDVLVHYNEIIPQKPLFEIVWDNISGAYWDPEKSKEIQMNKIGPAIEKNGLVITDQYIVPFGRILIGVSESILAQSFDGYYTCFKDACVERILNEKAPKYIVKIKIEEFRIWENPLNHINFSAKFQCYLFNEENKKVNEYNFDNKMIGVRIGNIWNTRSSFLTAINETANKFAEDTFVNIINIGGNGILF